MASYIVYSSKIENKLAATCAVEWIAGFYPTVEASLDTEGLRLRSSTHGEAALRLIWQTALINESLLSKGEARRAALLDELAR
jgi:hypothetical protein